MRRAAAVEVVVEVAAVPSGPAVRDLLAAGRDADDADHRPRLKRDALVHAHGVALDLEDERHGRLDVGDQLAELGDDRREAARPGTHVEHLDNHLHGRGARCTSPCDSPAGCRVGDMHAAMGDGEICGTGVEIAGEVDVRFDSLEG